MRSLMPKWYRWNDTLDAKLIRLCKEMNAEGVAAEFGILRESIWRRCHKLGVRPLSRGQLGEPPKSLWVEYATEAAKRHRVKASYLMAARSMHRVVRARQEAWRDLLARHPQYSISGLGRTSGFCRPSIIEGLRRLQAGPN